MKRHWGYQSGNSLKQPGVATLGIDVTNNNDGKVP